MKLNENNKSLNTDNEVRSLGKAISALAVVLWGLIPMLILGWLVSAIGRHDKAEAAIQDEPVYKLIIWWHGGTDMIPPEALLLLLIMILLLLSFVARSFGFSHPEDGLSGLRAFVQKILLPAMLSGAAFVCGILGNGTVVGLVGSAIGLVMLSLCAAIFYYFTETTRDVAVVDTAHSPVGGEAEHPAKVTDVEAD